MIAQRMPSIERVRRLLFGENADFGYCFCHVVYQQFREKEQFLIALASRSNRRLIGTVCLAADGTMHRFGFADYRGNRREAEAARCLTAIGQANARRFSVPLFMAGAMWGIAQTNYFYSLFFVRTNVYRRRSPPDVRTRRMRDARSNTRLHFVPGLPTSFLNRVFRWTSSAPCTIDSATLLPT
jgi:hypothetical protein